MRNESFHAAGPVNAHVRLTGGEVRLETVDSTEVTVELEGLNEPGRRAVENARVELNGDRLEIEVDRKQFGFTFVIGRGPAVRAHVRVPNGSAAQVEGVSADMEIEGRLREASLKTVSGDVTLKAEVEGDLEVKSVSGDVVGGSVSGEVAVNSVSGDVKIAEAAKGAQLKTVSGDLTIDSVTQGEVRVQSVSGDVRVGIAPGASVWMDLKSLSGKTTSELDVGDTPPEGEATKVEIRGNSVSGDIRITRAAPVPA